jgi:hypothetical protein
LAAFSDKQGLSRGSGLDICSEIPQDAEIAVLATVPLHWVIPALVFFGVVSLSIYLVAQSGQKRKPVKDEFSLSREPALAFKIPENYVSLEPAEKRRVTIQNLYLNHGQDLDSIAELLEVDKKDVEDVLHHYGHLRSSNSPDAKKLNLA